MSEPRSTSTARVKAYRERKRLGVRTVTIGLSERQIDWLADEGYLDGDNTVAQALEAFLDGRLRTAKQSRLC